VEAGSNMSRVSLVQRIFLSERVRLILIVVVWGVALASVFAQAVYQRAYLTYFDIGIAAAVCLFAGSVLLTIERALIGYLAAVTIAGTILYTMVTLPATLGTLVPPADLVLYYLWVTILFNALIPFPFMILLVSSIVGSLIGEKYLETSDFEWPPRQ